MSDIFQLQLLLMIRYRLQATVDALSAGTPPNLQVARGGKSPNNLATRESDGLHRNVIYKLPSYELWPESSHGGRCSDC